MGHKHDWWERLRRWLIPRLGIFTQFLEDITGDRFYVESETEPDQFVGRIPMDEEEFEVKLHEMGFERNPLAALKTLRNDPNNYERGSWRKVGFPRFPRMQLHVILYNNRVVDEDSVYVYAHWEWRWDTDPWKHYRGGDRYSGPEGVWRMKEFLNEYDIEYRDERPPIPEA